MDDGSGGGGGEYTARRGMLRGEGDGAGISA